ncbi:60S ribosomal protein L4-like [Triticum aestivum]|uniref:60S ribosomal protein L4-like n=1 Tax=Triticum aestivum TaxID=4565 RepID=UPI001D022D91|nr:60S ribosomal protein L4-like [Triticum aestivum]
MASNTPAADVATNSLVAGAMATYTRPLVSVKAPEGDMATVTAAFALPLPNVFTLPIRQDVITFAHRLTHRNKLLPEPDSVSSRSAGQHMPDELPPGGRTRRRRRRRPKKTQH